MLAVLPLPRRRALGSWGNGTWSRTLHSWRTLSSVLRTEDEVRAQHHGELSDAALTSVRPA